MAKHYCSVCGEDVAKGDYCYKCGLCKQHCICEAPSDEGSARTALRSRTELVVDLVAFGLLALVSSVWLAMWCLNK